MVAFSVERFIAITWPLHAKSILTKKMTLYSLIVILVFVVLTCIPTFIAFNVRLNPVGYYDCNLVGVSRTLSMMMAFISTAQKYPISTFVFVFMASLVGIKLIMITRSKADLGVTARGRNKEMNAGLVLLLLAAIHGVIYSAESITWETIYVNNIFPFLNTDTVSFLFKVGQVVDTSTIIVRLWNIYPYFFRIPAFRQCVYKLFCIHCKERQKIM